MQTYQARKIEFKEVIQSGKWKVKVYTIAKTGDFDHPDFYAHVKQELPNWLALKNGFDASHDYMGFLILHAGTEGIFSLINWWVGTNMLNTHIFITSPKRPVEFTKISGDGLAPCIWELAVINHERIAWTKHILQLPDPLNFDAYLADVFDEIL